jgi:hypothetical protein
VDPEEDNEKRQKMHPDMFAVCTILQSHPIREKVLISAAMRTTTSMGTVPITWVRVSFTVTSTSPWLALVGCCICGWLHRTLAVLRLLILSTVRIVIHRVTIAGYSWT